MGAHSRWEHQPAQSRRGLLAAGAAALALGPRSALGAEQKPTVPAKDLGDRLTVAVRIDGKGPYRFVVDSGAERSVLAVEVATALDLPVSERVLVHGIARSVPADAVQAGRLEIGRIRVRGLALPVLPRDWIEADGYLGLDVLDGHRVELDFRRKTLTLGEPLPRFSQFRGPNQAIIAAGGVHGKLTAVDCRVDGVNVAAFLDTGAELSVGNPALLAAVSRRAPIYAGMETVSITGLTGGVLDCPRVSLKRMELPEITIEDFSLAIADLKIFEVWRIAQKPALFIGMDILRQFNAVVIDYGRSEYRFNVGAAGPWRRARDAHRV